MAFSDNGPSAKEIKFEAGKNYLIKIGSDIQEIKVHKLAGTYMLAAKVHYNGDESFPNWGDKNKYTALEIVGEHTEDNNLSERADWNAIQVLQADRFESDAYYVHIKDLKIIAQHDERTDLNRVVEHAENYVTEVAETIKARKKVYFVHSDGGIQLIKLQS